MDQSKRQLVKKNKLNLTEWLQLDPQLILQHVHSEEIITDREYNTFKVIRDPVELISDLLDKLYAKGEETCAKFLCMLDNKGLKETYPELARWLAAQSDGSRPSTTDVVDSGYNTQTVDQIQDKLVFLEKNRSFLVKSVTNTMAILDYLKEEGFHSEMISEVAAERTNEAKMRMILDRIKVQKHAEILFKALAMYERDVLNDCIAKYKK